jgi:hypothetical protein
MSSCKPSYEVSVDTKGIDKGFSLWTQVITVAPWRLLFASSSEVERITVLEKEHQHALKILLSFTSGIHISSFL